MLLLNPDRSKLGPIQVPHKILVHQYGRFKMHLKQTKQTLAA